MRRVRYTRAEQRCGEPLIHMRFHYCLVDV